LSGRGSNDGERLPEAIFAIGPSKSEAAALLEASFDTDVIIVDDGFQHRALQRNCDLLLVDASYDLRKEKLFPLGRRREPLNVIGRAIW